MRISALIIAAVSVIGCGSSSNQTDMTVAVDMSMSSAVMDLAMTADAKIVTPFNNPGNVFCYTGPLCSTTSATPVCCDSASDGGFSDTCVASSAACLAMDSAAKVFACGQKADCTGGDVCCSVGGMSSKGNPFLTSTACAATCQTGAGDNQLCVTAAECKTGTTCVGMSISGRAIGICK